MFFSLLLLSILGVFINLLVLLAVKNDCFWGHVTQILELNEEVFCNCTAVHRSRVSQACIFLHFSSEMLENHSFGAGRYLFSTFQMWHTLLFGRVIQTYNSLAFSVKWFQFKAIKEKIIIVSYLRCDFNVLELHIICILMLIYLFITMHSYEKISLLK